MARSADSVTRRVWQERLQRFERGRLTVAAFCRAEGVSPASLYQWRRMVRQGDPATSRTRTQDRSAAIGRQAFVPVNVVATATVEVHLPNGVRLAVSAADPAALEAVVAAVGRLPQAARQEVESC